MSKLLLALVSAVLVASLMVGAVAAAPLAEALSGVSAVTGGGEIAVSWDEPSTPPTDYRVIFARSGEAFSYKERTDPASNAYPTGPKVTLSGLDAGAEYKIRVRARWVDGDTTTRTAWSDTVTATAGSPPEAEPEPEPKDKEQTEDDDDDSQSRNHGDTSDDPNDEDDAHSSTATMSVLKRVNVGGTSSTVDKAGQDREITVEGDIDWHKMTLSEGEMYTFGVFGSTANYKNDYVSDPVAAIYDSSGNMVAINGEVGSVDHKYRYFCDCATSLSPGFSYFATRNGTYYLAVWASTKDTSEPDFKKWKREGFNNEHPVDYATTGKYKIKITNNTLTSSKHEWQLWDGDGWHGYPTELWLHAPSTPRTGTSRNNDIDTWRINLQGGERYCVYLQNTYTGNSNPEVEAISQSDDKQRTHIPMTSAKKGETGFMTLQPKYTGGYDMTIFAFSTDPVGYSVGYWEGGCS